MGEQPPIRPEQRKPAPRKPKPIAEVLEANAPWKPTPYDDADVGALQALNRGDAPGYLQQRALKWIIELAAGTYDLHYRPGTQGQRDTDFALGRAYVGQQIVKLLKIDLHKLNNRGVTDG